MKNVLSRLKSPWLWLGAAGLVYNVLARHGVVIDQHDWQTAVDVISFVAIGVGVYSNHTEAGSQDAAKPQV